MFIVLVNATQKHLIGSNSDEYYQFISSIVTSTGQWSDPKTSAWIFAPVSFSRKHSEVRK
jgi:hypothetical protein